MIIPDLIQVMREQGKKLEVVITVSQEDTNPIAIQFKEKLNKMQVSEYVHMVGRVDRKDLSALYRNVDYVFLLSRLESFSNNIIEAWYFRKPLVISDEEWAHGICKDAAIYVDRDNPYKIANEIISANKSGYYKDVINRGEEEYKSYPSINERTGQELEYVKQIAKET